MLNEGTPGAFASAVIRPSAMIGTLLCLLSGCVTCCSSGSRSGVTHCPTSGCALIPVRGRAPLAFQRQRGLKWCWAASAAMVMESVHVPSPSQCTQVKDTFSPDDPEPESCCDDSGYADADGCELRWGWPAFDRYGFRAKKTCGAALSDRTLMVEIGCYKRPVAFSHRRRSNGVQTLEGHMMVATGYTMEGNELMLEIADPQKSCNPELRADAACVSDRPDLFVMSYEAYRSIPEVYDHWDDFYAVEPVSGSIEGDDTCAGSG